MYTTGSDFVKKIKPIGCFMFLALGILMTVICFTAKGTPLEGYEAPNDSAYYGEHIEELAQELRDNLIPLTGCDVTAEPGDGCVVISGTESAVNALRPYVVHYYDAELFVFKY